MLKGHNDQQRYIRTYFLLLICSPTFSSFSLLADSFCSTGSALLQMLACFTLIDCLVPFFLLAVLPYYPTTSLRLVCGKHIHVYVENIFKYIPSSLKTRRTKRKTEQMKRIIYQILVPLRDAYARTHARIRQDAVPFACVYFRWFSSLFEK